MTRLRHLPDPDHLPALRDEYAHRRPALDLGKLDPPPRILLLYGSLRERSYSRLTVEEAARLLRCFGCETRVLDPSICRCPIRSGGTTTPRSPNCANIRCGRKGRSGAARNDTGRSPGS